MHTVDYMKMRSVLVCMSMTLVPLLGCTDNQSYTPIVDKADDGVDGGSNMDLLPGNVVSTFELTYFWEGDATLRPFRTIAVDDESIALGSAFYVEELDGLTMPGTAPWGGFTHDGCVVAEASGAFTGDRIELYTATESFHKDIATAVGAKIIELHGAGERCTPPTQ